MVLPALMAPMLRKAATEWKFASGNQFTAPAAASTVPAAVLAGAIAASRAMRSFSLILVFMVFGFQDEGGAKPAPSRRRDFHASARISARPAVRTATACSRSWPA